MCTLWLGSLYEILTAGSKIQLAKIFFFLFLLSYMHSCWCEQSKLKDIHSASGKQSCLWCLPTQAIVLRPWEHQDPPWPQSPALPQVQAAVCWYDETCNHFQLRSNLLHLQAKQGLYFHLYIHYSAVTGRCLQPMLSRGFIHFSVIKRLIWPWFEEIRV